MLAVLCTALFLRSALSLQSQVGALSREFYVQTIARVNIPFIPPNDAEVWFGWRRIYMGESVFPDVAGLKFSVKFDAPQGGLSTVVEIDPDSHADCFKWVRVNIPGTDSTGGEDVRTRHPSAESQLGTRAVLVYPQTKRLDLKSANQTLTTMKQCDVAGLERTFELNRVVAINVYQVSSLSCGDDKYRFSNHDTPDWNYVRPNMEKITNREIFLTPPSGVLEVEYHEGVSLRMGNCLPMFLTASAPSSIKFISAPDTYYTLCFVEHTESFSCQWLLVNVPGGDIGQGLEVVPYSPYGNVQKAFHRCVFVLFSQDKNKIAPSDIKRSSSLSPRALSDKFKLGEPVAANFYLAYWAFGVPPEKRLPAPSTSPHTDPPSPATSPQPGTSIRDLSSTGGLPLTTSERDVVTPVKPTTTSSASMLLRCSVYVALTGLLIIFRDAVAVGN